MAGERNPGARATRSTRDRQIVALRARGLTLKEIGEQHGLSRQRVAQILERASTHTPADPTATPQVGEARRAGGRTRKDDRSGSPGPPPEGGRTRAAVAERRAHVRQLLVEGLPPSEIAARLDGRLTTVYADLAWIRAADAQPLPPQ